MIKYFSMLLLCGIAFFTVSQAQTITISPYGVSPRDAAVNANDIFDRAYNALPNVGANTKMYLKATLSTGNFTGGVWSLNQKPAGSNPVFGFTPVKTSNTNINSFTPDLPGKYILQFTDGTVTGSLTINVGLYLGAEGTCSACHNGKYVAWKGTGHSSALQRGLDGLKGDHFSANCVSCHSTGNDTKAVNNGFDDFPFVFPSPLVAGNYNNLLTKYPDAMKRANIQCESCHGPGSEHMGNKADNKITQSFDSKVCAYCHDSGTHHVYPAQYDVSVHATGTHQYAQDDPSRDRSSCMRCHNGSGFLAFLDGEPQTETEKIKISCVTCHDPHANPNSDHQLRSTKDVELYNGEMVTQGGFGKLCMNCHNSRVNAVETIAGTRPQPHHAPQAEILSGKNIPTFGYKLPSSPHLTAAVNSCVDCHMTPGLVDANNNVLLVGAHTLNMRFPDGSDNIAACTPCHGTQITSSFADKKYYFNGVADHDGDGVNEGVKDEVKGMMAELALLLHPAGEATVNARDANHTYSVAEKTAIFNYLTVEEDRSHGIHNPAFVVNLLRVSLEAMKYGVITAGTMQSVTDVPNDQGYQVRVVWTKFGADDGVAPDQVKSYTILRKVEGASLQKSVESYTTISQIPSDISIGKMFKLNGDMWDVVQSVEALQFGEYSAVVPTLKNTVAGDTSLATFKVLGKTAAGMIAETTPMSGYSVDNLAPAAPSGVALSLANNGIKISWDESADKDFNYFTVYKMVGSADKSKKEFVVSLTSNSFTDMNLVSGQSVYYSVSAFDFSNNESDLSDPQTLGVTSVEDEAGMPTEYKLYSNYPNPFNPETNIKYSMPQSGLVNLTVFNSLGQQVALLVNEVKGAGYYTVSFNASNYPSGVYYYRITTSEYVQTKKMVLLK